MSTLATAVITDIAPEDGNPKSGVLFFATVHFVANVPYEGERSLYVTGLAAMDDVATVLAKIEQAIKTKLTEEKVEFNQEDTVHVLSAFA